jgi:hypothetical protein
MCRIFGQVKYINFCIIMNPLSLFGIYLLPWAGHAVNVSVVMAVWNNTEITSLECARKTFESFQVSDKEKRAGNKSY